MKKKIIKTLYYVPFILHLMFYLFIIFTDGITNLKLLEIILLLVALFTCGYCFSNDNKKTRIIAPIILFITAFSLIVTGIKNTYFVLFETTLATFILIYYLFILFITKKKFHAYTTFAVIFVLSILFVPIKSQYMDGGTIEYKSLSYKYIKWHRIRHNQSFYEGTDIYWFPNNMKQLEYYAPIEIPIVTVSNLNDEIICNSASYSWSKKIGKEIKHETGLSIDPIEMDYEDELVLTKNKEIKINTEYTISDVMYTELTENENHSIYKSIDYEKYSKTLILNDLKPGTYIFKFNITKDSDEANYSFKIRVKE